ncbi:VOC family protein [Ornithinicoccus halotolerans]|uniref:VOC family protein n=1 Tax=Ornithinicoccus halotolerans TaxID=1748220 RepID=UPI001296913C|nr:VOC family protein [Ornithinicoccus halotolerans]
MRITRSVVVLDAANLAEVSSFWARLLGGTVEADDDWHTVSSEQGPRIAVQLAPEHVPPEWPDGLPQQVHLDLYVDDPDAAHDEAVAAGARVLQTADTSTEQGFQVYADPAGHPFCLCWARGS